MRKYMLLVIYGFLSVVGLAQQPVVEWAKTYGGKYWDFGESILVTSDNKYVIAGGTSSQDNDTLERATKVDGLIMKLNSDGQIIWKRTYGGNGHDGFGKIIQTKDGSFIAVGSSSSTDGLFTTNKGNHDVWILKLDSLGGFQWQKTYGGSNADAATSIVEDINGGYLFVMSSSSDDKDFNIQFGTPDGWIVKIDTKGEIIWKKHFGGSDYERLSDIISINDGLFLALGVYRSKDSTFTGLGNLAIQIDSKGNVIWQKSHGSPYNTTSYFNGYESAILTKDGNIVAFGNAWAFNLPMFHNSLDFLLTKMDMNGNLLWSKMYGGVELDVGQSILELPSGELIAIGNTLSGNMTSIDGDLDPNCRHGDNQDIWVLKLDSVGQIIWKTCLGGASWDYPRSSVLARDGAILITGDTQSSDGIFSKNYGGYDIPLIKLRDVIKTPIFNNDYFENFKYYPNPANENLTIENNTEGEVELKLVNSIGQTFYHNFYEIGIHQIACSQLPIGFYQLILTTKNNTTISKKIIIQR